MFSRSKNVLEKSVSFLALVWGLPFKRGQEWTKESEADQQALFEGHEVSKQREEFIRYCKFEAKLEPTPKGNMTRGRGSQSGVSQGLQ